MGGHGPRRPRLGADSRFAELVEGSRFALGTTKPAAATVAAYRRDLVGVARRIGADDEVGVPRLEHLTKAALREALVSDLSPPRCGGPTRPGRASSTPGGRGSPRGQSHGRGGLAQATRRSPRATRAPDAAARLPAVAATVDPRGRDPWPQRDRALVATFCVTGIREGEAVALGMASVADEAGARHLEVVGQGLHGPLRSHRHALEAFLDAYHATRATRFPGHDLDHSATALFVDVRGRRHLSGDQIKYLIERLYVRAGLRARVPAGALVHALRHSFATSALQAGADVVELQTMLGHQSLDTTRRYLDASTEGPRQVIKGHPGQIALREHLRDSTP